VNETRNLDGTIGAGGGVLAFAINRENGSLRHVNTQPSMGVNPCYVTIDTDGSRLLVANHGQSNLAVVRVERKNGVAEIEHFYDDGTVAIFGIRPDGSLEPARDVSVLERKPGLAANSQPTGQPHSVNFDPSHRFALACDVGTDNLYVYRIDSGSLSLANVQVFPTTPGRAPRFSAFHPRLPYVFVVNERESSLSSFHFDSRTGEVRPIQTVPTVPAGYSGRNAPSDVHVHPNGKFVYGSNRGHDSIAIFRIDEATGMLTQVEVVKTQGQNPRGFGFEPSGHFIVVGNQASNNLVTFAVDPDSGRMTPTGGKADVARPACVRFARSA
jgi:6-phosphogluconolactonase